MSDSLLSIVAHPSKPDLLVVRARAAGDIEAVFPFATVLHTPDRDYAYRTFLSRQVVAEHLAARVTEIDYTNFKNSVRDHDRHGFYYGAYNAVLNLGRRLRKPDAYTEPIPF